MVLGSKDPNPAHIAAVYANLAQDDIQRMDLQ